MYICVCVYAYLCTCCSAFATFVFVTVNVFWCKSVKNRISRHIYTTSIYYMYIHMCAYKLLSPSLKRKNTCTALAALGNANIYTQVAAKWQIK